MHVSIFSIAPGKIVLAGWHVFHIKVFYVYKYLYSFFLRKSFQTYVFFCPLCDTFTCYWHAQFSFGRYFAIALYMLLPRLAGIGDGIDYTLSRGTLGTTGLCELAQNFQTIVVYFRRVIWIKINREWTLVLSTRKSLAWATKPKTCNNAGTIDLDVLPTHEVTILQSTQQPMASSWSSPAGSTGQVSSWQAEPKKGDPHVVYWNVRAPVSVNVKALAMQRF